jgi:alpha-L-arabinofuranosidase
MAVTEWNIDAGSWGLGRGKQMTLIAALMNARYLHVLMRHSDKVEIACRSNMANSYCGAIYETSPGGFGVLKRPSYYVMQLYARHAKPVPLALKPPNHRLDLFACSSLDRKTIVVFAVNQGAEPMNSTTTFEGFDKPVRAIRAESVCDVLNAGQPDVMNHWGAPERVKIVPLSSAGNDLILPPLSATALECQVE